MGRYLKTFHAVQQAKRVGKDKPPELARNIRLRIEEALFGTRIETLFESPVSSRLWQEFESACRRLDRTSRSSRHN